MANSLTDWLSNKVLSFFNDFDLSLEQEYNKESLLEDVAYLKGAKIQIVRFFAPQYVSEAEKELKEGSQASESSPMAKVAGEQEEIPLWACVADRKHFVHVKFSDHCVKRFNGNYSRELISLSGSIIILRKFKPSVSYIPSILETKRSRRGPFAPPEPILPTLLLEIESFEVLGSINEVIFWDTTSLQASLLGDEFAIKNKGFKSWFRQVEKILKSEERRRERKRQRIVTLGDQSIRQSGPGNETVSSASANTTSTVSHSEKQVSPYAPPPFQRRLSKPLVTDSLPLVEDSQHTSSQSDRNHVKRTPWGDFQLSMGEDDFGIEAAASQMLDQHTLQKESECEEDSRDMLDPLSMSLNEPPDIEMTAELNVIPSMSVSSIRIGEGDPNRDSQKTDKDGSFMSQSFSLPFSIESSNNSKENEDIVPIRNRSESTLLKEMEGYTTFDRAEEQSLSADASAVTLSSQKRSIEHLQESRSTSKEKITPDKEVRQGNTDMLEDRSRRSEAGLVESPTIASLALSMGSSEEKEKHKWNNLIRRVTPEQVKERERTYSSRVDLIVD